MGDFQHQSQPFIDLNSSRHYQPSRLDDSSPSPG
jgi:hypothetical protein